MQNKGLLKKVQSLDAFPKVEKEIQVSTGSGGFATVVISLLLAYLTLHECYQFFLIRQKFDFLIDQTKAGDHALQVNIDMTVRTGCDHLRVDVLDVSGESMNLPADVIKKEPATWDTEGLDYLSARSESGKIDVKKIIRKAQRNGKRDADKAKASDSACRLIGNFNVNKVTGMFHITAIGHGYFGKHTPHELDTLSFGKYFPGLQNPLDGTYDVAETHLTRMQYFIAVVPTTFIDATGSFVEKSMLTNQYAVTEYKKAFENEQGGELGTPGIFFKYELEPISVRVTEYKQSFSHFIARLCGIVGGIFVTTGIVLEIGRWALEKASAVTSGGYQKVSSF